MQEDLNSLFERSGAIALVEGEDQDEPVELITTFEGLKKKPFTTLRMATTRATFTTRRTTRVMRRRPRP